MLCTLTSAILRIFKCTFPFEDCPALKIILCQLGENCFEIDLSITNRAKAASPCLPILISTIDTLTTRWVEFSIFYMEHLDPLMVDVDELQVVEALQDKMRWIV
ncbi:hypothetical protein D3C81_1165070 [compost metagenome]